jgi:ketopantoate reductase
VSLWLRNEERANSINLHRQNLEYLPDYLLDDKLWATTALEQAVAGVDIVLVAVPSKSFREVVRDVSGLVSTDTLLISLTKGIEASGFRLMSEILQEEMPDNPRGVLSGPNQRAQPGPGNRRRAGGRLGDCQRRAGGEQHHPRSIAQRLLPRLQLPRYVRGGIGRGPEKCLRNPRRGRCCTGAG